ncbi:MAG: hypothetical protein EBR26_05205, partial [Microbacteriaceae bacterium]|nr:hypothetical protein [Microbacteriaceae bacterium]
MKSFCKRFLGLSIALLAGLGTSVQADAVSLPTTIISFPALTKVTYGSPDIALNISESAGVTTATSITPSVCAVVNNTTVTILSAGVCKITATNPGNANAKPARAVTRSMTVAKAPNTVTLSDFGWLSMANPTADLSFTQTAGTTTLTNLSSKFCTLNGNRVTAIKVGTCTIR